MELEKLKEKIKEELTRIAADKSLMKIFDWKMNGIHLGYVVKDIPSKEFSTEKLKTALIELWQKNDISIRFSTLGPVSYKELDSKDSEYLSTCLKNEKNLRQHVAIRKIC